MNSDTLKLLEYYNKYLETYVLDFRDIFWVFFVPMIFLFIYFKFNKQDNFRFIVLMYYLLFILSLFSMVCLYQIKKQYLKNEIQNEILTIYQLSENKEQILSDLNNDELMKQYDNYLIIRDIITKKK